MSDLTAFEVQSFRDGAWKIEAITDSKEFAVHTAEQTLKSRSVTKVRVVQETAASDSSETKTRVVFFRDKNAAKQTKARPAEPAAAARPVAPPGPVATASAAARKPWSTSAVGLVLNFSAIVVAGIALVLALRYLGASP